MLSDKEIKEYNTRLRDEYKTIYNRYIKHNQKKLNQFEMQQGLDKVMNEYKSLLNNPVRFYEPQPEHRPIYNLVYAVLGLSLWDEDEYKKQYELSCEYYEANKSYREIRLNKLEEELKPRQEFIKELNENARLVDESNKREYKAKKINRNKL